jgi:flagellar motor switch protein FliN
MSNKGMEARVQEKSDKPSAVSAAAAQPKSVVSVDDGLLADVEVDLTAVLGQGRMTVAQLKALKSGTVVTLDESVADQADLLLNGKRIARGEIVMVGDQFGIRITELGKPE